MEEEETTSGGIAHDDMAFTSPLDFPGVVGDIFGNRTSMAVLSSGCFVPLAASERFLATGALFLYLLHLTLRTCGIHIRFFSSVFRFWRDIPIDRYSSYFSQAHNDTDLIYRLQASYTSLVTL